VKFNFINSLVVSTGRILVVILLFSLPLKAQVPDPQIRTGHPRLFFRQSDYTALHDRVYNQDGWGPLWNEVVSWCNSNASKSPASLVGTGDEDLLKSYSDNITFSLAFCGWIENDQSIIDKAIAVAVYTAGLFPDNVSSVDWRIRQRGQLGLAYVYDFLYDRLNSDEQETISGKLHKLNDSFNPKSSEHIVGHTTEHQALKLLGTLALAGDGNSDWDSEFDEVLTYWYEPEVGFIEALCAFQGLHSGSGYARTRGWQWMKGLTALANATENINPFADDNWGPAFGEFLLHAWDRGDGEKISFGDTSAQSSPYFTDKDRIVIATLAGRYAHLPIGRQLHWLYDSFHDISIERNLTSPDYELAESMVLFDAAAPAAAPTISDSRLFDMGVLFHRSSWNLSASTVVMFLSDKYYRMNHSSLGNGHLQIVHRGDPVVLRSGHYEWQNSHDDNWYKRSISHSGAPLIYDPDALYTRWSEVTENDGGQPWKKFEGSSKPDNMKELREDGGGLAWSKGEVLGYQDTTDYTYIRADIERAYRREYDDSPRTPVLDANVLILKTRDSSNFRRYPLVLYHHHVVSANASWRKAIPWNFARRPTVSQSTGRIEAESYHQRAKVVIDVFDPEEFTLDSIDGFGYNNGQWPAQENYGSREIADRGGYRVEVVSNGSRQEVDFLTLLMPLDPNDIPPDYTWIEDGDSFGIEIDSGQYLINKRTGALTAPGGNPPADCIDSDGDGYGTNCAAGEDCDDTRAEVNPSRTEIPGNGLDDDCNPLTPDVQSNEGVYLYLEAEQAELTSPMAAFADSAASSDGYISAPNGGDRGGKAVLNFSVRESGTYVIWGRTIAPTNADDSFHVSLDEDQIDTDQTDGWSTVWNLPESTEWVWNRVRIGVDGPDPDRFFDLIEGRSHTLYINGRETGAQLDAILITDNMDFVPSGIPCYDDDGDGIGDRCDFLAVRPRPPGELIVEIL
jgi:hypothetical protein